LMVVRVAQYLLMLHADAGVQRGLLKAKVRRGDAAAPARKCG